MNKGGRPFTYADAKLYATSFKLTREQQVEARRRGGSKWLRNLLDENKRKPLPPLQGGANEVAN